MEDCFRNHFYKSGLLGPFFTLANIPLVLPESCCLTTHMPPIDVADRLATLCDNVVANIPSGNGDIPRMFRTSRSASPYDNVRSCPRRSSIQLRAVVV